MLRKLIGVFGLFLAMASAWCGSIGEGIGNTSLTWTTGGDPSTPDENVNWSYCDDDGHKDSVCATSGAGGAGIASSWLKTSVVGPCKISFYYKVQTFRGEFRVACDSRVLYRYTGETGIETKWKQAEFKIPSGRHTLSFTYKHPGMGYAYEFNGVRIDDFIVIPLPDDEAEPDEKMVKLPKKESDKTVASNEEKKIEEGTGSTLKPFGSTGGNHNGGGTASSNSQKPVATAEEKKLGEGIGNTSLIWTTGGVPSTPDENVNWRYNADDGHKGKGCVTSGAGGAGVATSWLKTTIVGPCRISFYYRVQTYRGEFRVECDSTELYKYTGETGLNNDWKQAEYRIPAGEHTLTFTYKHPGMGYAYQLNGVCIDDFRVIGSSGNSR